MTLTDEDKKQLTLLTIKMVSELNTTGLHRSFQMRSDDWETYLRLMSLSLGAVMVGIAGAVVGHIYYILDEEVPLEDILRVLLSTINADFNTTMSKLQDSDLAKLTGLIKKPMH